MDENEWFTVQWSQDDLKEQYKDDRIDKYRREHAFHRYWKTKLQNEEGIVLRDDLEEIIRYSEWQAVVGGLIGDMATKRRLTEEDAQWLQSVLPPGEWGYEQVQALNLLYLPSLSPLEKFRKAVETEAYWTLSHLYALMNEPDRHESLLMIEDAPINKKLKIALRQRLNSYTR